MSVYFKEAKKINKISQNVMFFGLIYFPLRLFTSSAYTNTFNIGKPCQYLSKCVPTPPPLRHEPGPEWCQIRVGYVRTRQWLRCWHWYEMINDFFSACVTTTVGRYITTYWKLFDTKRSVRKNDTNIHEKFTQWYISTKSVLHVKFFLYIYTKLSKLNFRIYFHHC